MNQFINDLKSVLKEMLPQCSVVDEVIIHTNGTALHRLSIVCGNSSLVPVIFANNYYHCYKSGELSLDEIAKKMVELYESNKHFTKVPKAVFSHFDLVKTRIIFSLINKEKNKQYLQNVPHIDFLEFAVVFYLHFSNNISISTIPINNSLMEFWEKTPEDLFQCAKENTPEIFPPLIVNIAEEYAPDDLFIRLLVCSDIYFYALSNKPHIMGAACLLYDNVLKDFANRKNRNLYILPSSTAEVILVPEFNSTNVKELINCLRETNSDTNLLPPELFLSDNVYYYNRFTDKIELVTFCEIK